MEANWKELKRNSSTPATSYSTAGSSLSWWNGPSGTPTNPGASTSLSARASATCSATPRSSSSSPSCWRRPRSPSALPLLESPYARRAKRRRRLARGRHLYGRPALTEILCMYYPQDVEEDMGPTMLLPGSHRGSTRRRRPLSWAGSAGSRKWSSSRCPRRDLPLDSPCPRRALVRQAALHD